MMGDSSVLVTGLPSPTLVPCKTLDGIALLTGGAPISVTGGTPCASICGGGGTISPSTTSCGRMGPAPCQRASLSGKPTSMLEGYFFARFSSAVLLIEAASSCAFFSAS